MEANEVKLYFVGVTFIRLGLSLNVGFYNGSIYFVSRGYLIFLWGLQVTVER